MRSRYGARRSPRRAENPRATVNVMSDKCSTLSESLKVQHSTLNLQPSTFSVQPSTFILSFLALLLVAGCSAHIEVRPAARQVAPPVATLLHGEHAVAILGVDYDPPQPAGGWTLSALGQGVTLIVAVANQGTAEERDVVVTAYLLDSTGKAPGRELAAETHVVKSLLPGQIAQVRFATASDVVRRSHYLLRVTAHPVGGEADTTDNTRTYEIVVRPDL
jgi:hypothetical protein